VAATFGGAEGTFSTLEGVALLFANPWLLVAGWLHYLAFDLLIGTWEARDARERRVPHLLLVPCLFLTLMFGPAGWLVYLGVRELRSPPRPS
jgi:threonine/homoserine/homoserine lactone efflux protein